MSSSIPPNAVTGNHLTVPNAPPNDSTSVGTSTSTSSASSDLSNRRDSATNIDGESLPLLVPAGSVEHRAHSIQLPGDAATQYGSVTVTHPTDPLTSSSQPQQLSLCPVEANTSIPSTVPLIKDVRTQKLFVVKDKKPAYSIAHTQGGPKLESEAKGIIGLGHAMPVRERGIDGKLIKPTNTGTRSGQVSPRGTGSVAGSRRGSADIAPGSRRGSTDFVASNSVAGGRSAAGSMDLNNTYERTLLLEQLRAIIHDEVRQANRGHTEVIKAHTEGQLKAAVEELAEAVVAGDDDAEKDQAGEGAQGEENSRDQAIAERKRNDIQHETQQQRNDGALVAGPALEKDAETAKLHADLIDHSDDGGVDEEDVFPNPWAKLRYHLREPFAEFLGTMILVIFGDGINNQVVLSTRLDPENAKGSGYLSIAFGWGIATGMGVWTCGGISGGLINPSVTIALATFRGFPWRKVPIYIFAQILGAVVGSMCIYGLYINPLRMLDPDKTQSTASLYTTFPADFITQPSRRITGFYNEVLATAVLLIVVLAIGDANNTPPVDGMAPLVLLWLVTGIGATLGWQTAYAVNPARDLGPRITMWIVGYSPRMLWVDDGLYWLVVPLLGTVVGALLGGFLYDALIYTGSESPLNRKWQFSDLAIWRRKKQAAEMLKKTRKGAKGGDEDVEDGLGRIGSRGPASFPSSFDSAKEKASQGTTTATATAGA